MRKCKRSGGADVIKATIIAFIAINLIAGGALQATSKNGDEERTTSSREDLEITGKAPIVWVGDEGAISLAYDMITVTADPVTEAIIYDEPVEVESTVTTVSEEPKVTEKPKVSQISEPEEKKENKLKIENITKDSTTTERIEAIFEYLISKDFTPEAAAGVIGNIAVESCFNPATVSDSGYYGLFQWNTTEDGEYWWVEIKNWLAENGYEWNSFEGQVRAFVECPHKGQLDMQMFSELKKLKNVEQATELVTVFYEGCIGGENETCYYFKGTCYQALSTRKKEAWLAYQMYKNKTDYNGQKAY